VLPPRSLMASHARSRSHSPSASPPKGDIPTVQCTGTHGEEPALMPIALSMNCRSHPQCLDSATQAVSYQKISRRKILPGIPGPRPPFYAPALSSFGFFSGFSGFT
jgi:hypothetical protein